MPAPAISQNKLGELHGSPDAGRDLYWAANQELLLLNRHENGYE